MTATFKFDVFLSHSSRDKAIVRPLAERLRSDGLQVWFDDWEIRPGDSIPAKIEEGLEQSRIMILCMSANAFGSDWSRLEAGVFRFRDPLNRDRRFIPLRLDDAEIKGSIAQFHYVSWLPDDRDGGYPKLLEACGRPSVSTTQFGQHDDRLIRDIPLKVGSATRTYAFSADSNSVLSGSKNGAVSLWDLRTGGKTRGFSGHTSVVTSVALSRNGRRALSASEDTTLRLWDTKTGKCLRTFTGHTARIVGVAWSADERYAVSGGYDTTIRIWEIETGSCIQVLEGHTDQIWTVALNSDSSVAFSAGKDKSVRVWNVSTGECNQVLKGHTSSVRAVVWNQPGYLASTSYDRTVRVWEIESGRCLRVLEGNTGSILCVAWSGDGRYIASGGGAGDQTVRIWDIETGECARIFRRDSWSSIWSTAWSADQRQVFSADERGTVRVWDISDLVAQRTWKGYDAGNQVQYTNAKVLLVGDSGAGKTGLSKRLALNEWQPSDSTVGAWATHWKLPVESADGVEREIWLWDFGGQADQRLIHQLYMDETALAVLVFDGQKDDLFETLGQWDRDLTRASRQSFTKLLVAGRSDAGGLRASKAQLEAFRKERGYLQLLETSAKTNDGCDLLRDAILGGIRWENIPWRSSPLLFRRLKEEIVQLKDAGRVLMRFNELRDTLQLKLAGELTQFTNDELKAVIGLLAGPGVVWELKFGSWVLLQPERINAYAQAVIQTMRADEQERGCLLEERVLQGDLTYQSSMARLDADEERFVLLAMHQTLVERGLCLREHTENGPLLVFPSYYRRERPELVGHPAVVVTYRFNGFLDDIYATLVVRLHHTKPFHQDQLWRYAADFKTLTGKQLGVKLNRRAEGAGELEVYFDPSIPMEEKIIFSKYVHEHLLQNASDVFRLRHYVCPHCGTPVGNREVAMQRLEEGKRDIGCLRCDAPDKRVPLWDDLEELFAKPEMKLRVRELQKQSAVVLDNESRERALVGEVISTVALAGQICREMHVSDHGIDMEIEFKSDDGEATGRKLYLQLKSGDSYLRKRKSDGAEMFSVAKERHLGYWLAQAFPVLLVIRNSEGEVRWMDIRERLRQAIANGQKPEKQVVFDGERFDVMSVRRWRDRVLAERVS